MTMEFSFWDMSGQVYTIDSNSENYNPEFKVGEIEEFGGIEYQILKIEDNTSNGMQAMAVAPVGEDGKADTSEVVIAYAGTNPSDIADIETDKKTIIGGNKEELRLPDGNYEEDYGYNGYTPSYTVEDSQIVTAEVFADDVKADYPLAEITTTGHSLGEYIALYIAAENEWGNVGFNGPDPYKILSPEAKQWVEDHSGMLFNYRNNKDTIGNYGGNGTGAEIRVDMDTKRDQMGTSHSMNRCGI